MCGIAGIVDRTGTVRPGLVQKMANCMQHRGPDAAGYYEEGAAALGHRRLSIIDLSDAANQPFRDNSGRYVMVFNGEIYNYLEVKALLPAYPFHTNSDTEVVIAAFAKWGLDCLQYLKGMFAIAIWDREESRLTLIRDRMGVKPVYYCENGDHLYFASEVRAILATGEVPRAIDPQGLLEYFSFQSISAPYTLIRNVRQLPAGHYLTCQQGQLTTGCWWSLLKERRSFDWNDRFAVHAEIRRLLTASVERRLVSDVPVGAFLSGGIDSSVVVGLMAAVNEKATNTFNICFDEPEYDESPYADIVAKKFNTNHTRIRLQPRTFIDELGTALGSMDTPSGDGINTYVVSKAIRKAGITVALSGIGGDELFAGYPLFRQFQRLHALDGWWRPAGMLRKLAGAFLRRPSNRQQRIREILAMPRPEIEYVYPISREMLTKEQLHRLTTLNGSPTVIAAGLAANKEALHAFPVLSQVTIAELMGYTQQTLLKDTDQMSMASSLEVREPFFDHELVAFVLSVPDAIKKPLYPKSLLVESVQPLLPGEIVHRPKKGFTFPWNVWMKNELRDFCATRIERMAQRPFVHGQALQQAWQGFLNGDGSMRWADLWLFIVLEEWLTINGAE